MKPLEGRVSLLLHNEGLKVSAAERDLRHVDDRGMLADVEYAEVLAQLRDLGKDGGAQAQIPFEAQLLELCAAFQ